MKKTIIISRLIPGRFCARSELFKRVPPFNIIIDSECVRSGNLMVVALGGLHRATLLLHSRALLRRARTAIELDGTRSSSC